MVMHDCAYMVLKSDALWERTCVVSEQRVTSPKCVPHECIRAEKSPVLPLATTPSNHPPFPRKVLKSNLEPIGKSCSGPRCYFASYILCTFTLLLNKTPCLLAFRVYFFQFFEQDAKNLETPSADSSNGLCSCIRVSSLWKALASDQCLMKRDTGSKSFCVMIEKKLG